MAGSTLKPDGSKELNRIFGAVSKSIGETLGSLVGRKITTTPGETMVFEVNELLATLRRPYAVVCGGFGDEQPDRSVTLLFDVQDAVAMVGLLMLSPEEAIAQARARSTLEGDDAAAFGELGNVMLSAVSTALADNGESVDIALRRHGVVRPGPDADLLGEGAVAVHWFTAQLADYPPTSAFVVIDLETAAAWNKGPLRRGVARAGDGGANGDRALAARADEAALEAIPEAPIRGALAAFVSQPDVFRLLRRSCRRVGLELRRHGKGEIPNPAAHRQEIVVVDVPPSDDRHFDWCRRIKDFSGEIRVVLLLHHPSRSRVAQAFHSRADVILGFPCEEAELSQKLAGLLEPVGAPTPQSPPQ